MGWGNTTLLNLSDRGGCGSSLGNNPTKTHPTLFYNLFSSFHFFPLLPTYEEEECFREKFYSEPTR
jgi:hypothetical protein